MSTTCGNSQPPSELTDESFRDSIQQFIHTQFPAARSRNIGPDDSLLTGGIIDSLGILEVVAFLESEFQLTVTEDDLLSDHFETVSRIADLVRRKRT